MEFKDVVKQKHLKDFFYPETIAVIGASDRFDKLGYHVMKSLLIGDFKGKVIPINPRLKEIMGLKVYSSLLKYHGKIDLAVFVIPSDKVLDVLDECYQKGIKNAVIITAGFKEAEGLDGKKREELLREKAKSYEISIIGPNTFGIVNLHNNLNASFTPEFSICKRGKVALVSQSGGMSYFFAFLAQRMNIGFSKIVGLGNRVNTDFSDMLLYLKEDPETDVIGIYIEGVDNPRHLVNSIKYVSKEKPVVVYKTGLSSKKDEASKSHTGSIAGRYEIYIGAFKQSGAILTYSSEEFLDAVKVLSQCPMPKGKKIAILSGQAGPAISAADEVERLGFTLASFSEEVRREIENSIPPMAIRSNPVDLGPVWHDEEANSKILKLVIEDQEVDCVVFLIMYASANLKALKRLISYFKKHRPSKPILTSIISPERIWDKEIDELESLKAIANYPSPERAVRALSFLFRYKEVKNRD